MNEEFHYSSLFHQLAAVFYIDLNRDMLGGFQYYIYIHHVILETKREQKAQQMKQDRTSSEELNRYVHKVTRCTTVHIKHHILISINLWHPATPWTQRCWIKPHLL
jgi:hypothetical protein